MNAWTTVGSVWPALSVPGMMRSGTILQASEERRGRGERADAERIEEVGDEADADLQRRREARVGRRVGVGVSAAVRRACATAHAHSPAKAIDKAPSAARRAEMGFMRLEVYPMAGGYRGSQGSRFAARDFSPAC